MTDFMTAWLQFLIGQGARLDAEHTQIVGFGNDIGLPQLQDGFVAPLTSLGLIAAAGDDAASFLHNQLTNDVEHLTFAEARLAGYCTPKGRLLATFLTWKTADAIMLQLPRQLQPAIQKRLQMFVLRAKVKLADASDTYAILGLGGRAAAALLTAWFPALPPTPYSVAQSDAGTLIRVADAFGAPRYQWIASPELAEKAWSAVSAALTPVGASAWCLADIHAAIPQITQVTQEQFVPQMINFEVIGGVNFKKGCYPGQEIVARSQYLGKLKRRMLPATVDADSVKAGGEVFSSADPDQPCGMIVNAESNLQGGIDCLVELKTAALDAGTVHVGSASGPLLKFGTLPYALLDATA
jgi:tRNA-modifying protein YgfZ